MRSFSIKVDLVFEVEAESGTEAIMKAQEIVGEWDPQDIIYFCMRGE